MSRSKIPSGIAAFTEYIKNAFAFLLTKMGFYGIPPEKVAPVQTAYDRFVAAEAVASNPETATTGNRRERDAARGVLEPLWRHFMNENIRYNPLVSEADMEVFGIKRGDGTRTPAGVPVAVPLVSLTRMGAFQFEVRVFDAATGKPKNPEHATGSYLYVAVTEIDHEPEHEEDFHKKDFSSNNRHFITFPREQLGKQLHVFARYSNAHGKEGPEGPTEVAVIN
jgi:hypothetical protein